MRTLTRVFACAATALVVFTAAGCGGDGGALGPSTPTGATDIGGSPMTSLPPPPPGWEQQDVVPQSQQQAQDTLIGYVKRTLQGLPDGTTLDATRYAGTGDGNLPCDDDATTPDAPVRFINTGDLKLPPGSDPAAAIEAIGDTWRQLGWYVVERDGFRKPNQFGYAPDGYRLQVVVAAREGRPPTLEGATPCFPGRLARSDIPVPSVVRAD